MEENSINKLRHISRKKYFFFLIGICLATLLTVVYTAQGQSSEAVKTDFRPKPVFRLSRKLENDEDLQSNVKLRQSRGGGFTVPGGAEDEWMKEYRENLTLLDGSYRDVPSVHRLLKSMTSQRTRDNYTHCSGIAPFVGPFSYLIESKNPCWYDQDVFRCVPYFFLAGFSKSGTSDLFGRLSRHPHVSTSNKEKHWLDYLRYFKNQDSIDYYTGLFKRQSAMIRQDIEQEGHSKIITGDGTPCYAWFNFYWPCYQGNQGMVTPKVTNAHVLYRMNPKAKVILLLRNPVSRLYSRYLTWLGKVDHRAYNKPGPAAFHALVTRAISLFNDCVQNWSVRPCAFNGTLYTQMTLRLQEGMYSVFIEDWLKVFPRDQILVLRFEDYATDITSNLKRVFQFLELDPLGPMELYKISTQKKRNKGKRYSLGQMWNSTKKVLEDFYDPLNKDLPNLLEDRTMHWSASTG